MKKIFALVLALMLALGMVGALAEPSDAPAADPTPVPFNNVAAQATYVPTNTASFTKSYTNSDKSPAVTFTFGTKEGTDYKATYVGFTNNEGTAETLNSGYPTVKFSLAEYADKDSTADKTVNITVDGITTSTKLGVYKYSFTENNGKVAGVTYAPTTYYLYLTVLRNEANTRYWQVAIHSADNQNSDTKISTVTNTYTSHSLTVSKEVTGNMADVNKDFPFTITLQLPDDAAEGTAFYTGALETTHSAGGSVESNTTTANTIIYTFNLKHGESLVINNIPDGIKYTINETKGSYTAYINDVEDSDAEVEGTLTTDVTKAFKNELKTNIDTGIALDTLPYILVLAVVAVGAILLIARRRRQNEE